MSCCKHSVMFGLTDAMIDPIAERCDLDLELFALAEALEKAGALGLYQDPRVVAGQALYDANSRMSASSSACATIRSGLRTVTAQIESLVIANMPPDERPGVFDQFTLWLKGLPNWALPVAGVAAGALVLASTAGGVFARQRGKRRSRR